MAPNVDEAKVAETAVRLFTFRQQHPWPATVVPADGWGARYADAAEGLDVLPDVAQAAEWVNGYLTRLAHPT